MNTVSVVEVVLVSAACWSVLELVRFGLVVREDRRRERVLREERRLEREALRSVGEGFRLLGMALDRKERARAGGGTRYQERPTQW